MAKGIGGDCAREVWFLGVIGVSKPRLVSDTRSELALAALRPSEYTAALI